MSVQQTKRWVFLSAGLGWFATLQSCDGGLTPTRGCLRHSSCASGYYCAGPNDRPRCGVPPQAHCADNTDCPGSLCHVAVDTCSPTGIGSECRPACSATSCGPGFRCNAQKACEPIPCDEGFTCPSYQRCDAVIAHAMAPVYAKTSGCVDIACSTEKDCPVGKACVNSACADGPGMCQRDLPVP